MHALIFTLSILLVLCQSKTAVAETREINAGQNSSHGYALLAAEFDDFKVSGSSLEDAIMQLCRKWAESENCETPAIKVHRYVDQPNTDG